MKREFRPVDWQSICWPTMEVKCSLKAKILFATEIGTYGEIIRNSRFSSVKLRMWSKSLLDLNRALLFRYVFYVWIPAVWNSHPRYHTLFVNLHRTLGGTFAWAVIRFSRVSAVCATTRRAVYLKRNIQALSRNHCCRGKAISVFWV
jgi:hypothetical protein